MTFFDTSILNLNFNLQILFLLSINYFKVTILTKIFEEKIANNLNIKH